MIVLKAFFIFVLKVKEGFNFHLYTTLLYVRLVINQLIILSSMKLYLKFVQAHIFAIGVILLSLLLLIPNAIECLMWKSGVTMGYAAIELIFLYIAFIFFIIAIISIVDAINKNYRVHALIVTMCLLLSSLVFAFRIISYAVFVISLLYAILFLFLFRWKEKWSFTKLNIIGLIIILICTIIDFKFLR